jgi:Zn-dependent M28 family amino/carboxypeptidase
MKLRRVGVSLYLVALILMGCGVPATPRTTSSPVPTMAPTPTPDPLAQALALAERVSADRLMADVRWLADDARRGRLTGSPEEDEVGEWLVQRFQELGLGIFASAGLEGYYLPFEAPAATRYGRAGEGELASGENVVAILPGTTQPDLYVYVGAHYDHLGVGPDGQVFNGADDDATGVAAVLEAARVLSRSGLRPEETVVFVAFSGEEIGLLGSGALCERLTALGLTDRSMLLNMEVLGAEKGAGTYLDVWDEEAAATGPMVEALQWAGDQLGIPIKQGGRDPGSDAVRLTACGVPAVSIDVAWSLENHPHYHRPSDDPQHIDVDGFRGAVQVAIAALWLLANDGNQAAELRSPYLGDALFWRVGPTCV